MSEGRAPIVAGLPGGTLELSRPEAQQAPSSAQPAPGPHPLVEIDYLIRRLGYLFVAGILGATLRERHAAPALWVVMLVHCFVWPHLAHLVARASLRSKQAEIRNVLFDAFSLGVWTAVLSYSPWPTTAILSSLLVGILGIGGWRLGLFALVPMAVGLLAGGVITGFQYQPNVSLLTTYVSIACIVAYGFTFGLITYAQARHLIRGRKLADEQKGQIEATNALLEEARLAAVAASSAKSQFLANMSHELRTPLNAIIGYSEMLQEDALERGAEETAQDLGKIRDAGKHLLGLINGVLDLSKIEAGKMQLYAETFEISAVVREALATARPLVQRNGNVLDVRCPDDIGTMRSDPTKLRQVLLNLLSNASKFTDHGQISLIVTRSPARDYIVFEVRDTGMGMTPEQQAQLFEPFTLIDAQATRKFGGTGLGLALSRRFCSLMGGDISVTSERGVGTTFTVRLPPVVPNTKKSGVFFPAFTPPDASTTLAR